MKSLRSILLVVVLMSLTTMAFAQTEAQKSSAAPVPSEAQKSFATMKSLAGEWEGPVTTVPQAAEVEGKLARFTLRVTSMGNALVHELSIAGRRDHPVTMFYLDGDRLLLTHYCDAGNRPRMVSKVSPDGKTVEFDFVDLSGGNQYGHMHHAVFTVIDANHHTEDWTWMDPGDKPTHARFDLQRTK